MKNVVIAGLALCAAACAAPRHRDEIGVVAKTDQVEPLGGDVYRVEAHNDGRSLGIMVLNHIFLRSAETAEQQGAQGFVVLTSAPTADRTGASFTIKLVRDPGPDDHYMNAANTIAEMRPLVYGGCGGLKC
jgi:hypothetical protein